MNISPQRPTKIAAIDFDAEINSLVYVELLPLEANVLGWKVVDLFEVNREDREKHLINALVEAVKELDISSREVYISLHGPSVYTFHITLPSIPPKEIPNALKWQLQGKIPFTLEEIAFDYELIKETTEVDGTKKIHFIAGLALKKEIEKACSLIEKIGLQPAKVNLSPFCILNLISSLKDMDTSKIYAVLEIGWQGAEFSFYHEKKLILSRPIPVGINNFIHALQTSIVYSGNRLSLSDIQAYQILKEIGLPEDISGNWQGFPHSQIIVLMRPELEKLVVELARSLEYFAANFNLGSVEKIWATGAGTGIPGIVKFLTQNQNLNTNLEILPVQMKGIPEDSKELSYISCALGNALSQKGKINLSSYKYGLFEAKLFEKVLRFITLGILGFLLVSIFILNTEIGIYKKRLNFIHRQKPMLNRLSAMREEADSRERLKAILLKDTANLSWVLKEISRITLSNVMLTELSIKSEEKTMELNGIIFSDLIPEITLTKFMKNIENSKILKKTSLIWIRKDETGKQAEFKLTFDLR